jgi:hypothetical protein
MAGYPFVHPEEDRVTAAAPAGLGAIETAFAGPRDGQRCAPRPAPPRGSGFIAEVAIRHGRSTIINESFAGPKKGETIRRAAGESAEG